MPDITKSLWDIRAIEKNAQKKTALGRIHPLAKLAVTLCYIVCVVSLPRYEIGGLLIFAIYPFLMLILSEIPVGQLFSRLLLVLPVAAAACVANLFLDTQAAFQIGTVAVSYGFLSFASVLVKVLLTVAAALLLIATTPLAELAVGLRQLRIPEMAVTQLLLIYRYLDLLIREASAMYTAYKLRAPGQKGIRWHDMGSFLGGLLVRTIGRGERIYDAMKLRGFSGSLSVRAARPFSRADVLFLAGLCALFVAARLIGVEKLVGGMLV